MSIFYDNLVSICALKNISPTRVALNIGLSNAAPYKWKNGNIPSDTTLKKLADYLNVSVSELMGENKNIPIPKTENEDISPARRQLLDSVDGMNEEQIIKLMGIINEAKKLL